MLLQACVRREIPGRQSPEVRAVEIGRNTLALSISDRLICYNSSTPTEQQAERSKDDFVN